MTGSSDSRPSQSPPSAHVPYQASEPPLPIPPQTDAVDDTLDLRELLGTLLESKWLILAITMLVLAGGLFYAWQATPRYRADVLLQVEESKSAMTGFEGLTAAMGGQLRSSAEIEVIKSRSVLGKAVDRLGLEIVASPQYLPVIGAAIARGHADSDTLASPFLGLDMYAWGGERIQVDRLDIPPALEGVPLTLVSDEHQQYRLLTSEGRALLTGTVGDPAESRTPPGEGVTLFVSELRARPGTSFSIRKRARHHAIADLQSRLEVSEKGSQTGILQIALEGSDPDLVARTVDTIANAYLRQNVERRSEEAEQRLAFLDGQLPRLKDNLVEAEEKLNAYRASEGTTADLTLESQTLLGQMVDVERQIVALEIEQSEYEQKYTPNHPQMRTLNERLNRLKTQQSSYNAELRSLPETQKESVRLVREARVANELYLMLLNKAQELRIAKAGTVGNVHILDHAVVPDFPVAPHKTRIVAVAMVLGLFGGVGAALLRKFLRQVVEDPDVVERQIGLPVYATVPLSPVEKKLSRPKPGGEGIGPEGPLILAWRDAGDPAVESLRSLRTSLQFALLEARNNIISIAGATPGIGKSFISLNLAALLAETDRRVLLIDSDMRRGNLHTRLGGDRSPGLSRVITGECELAKSVRTPSPNLHVLPTGLQPPNPSELLMSQRFVELLQEASRTYDLVLLDAPPWLAVTDGVLVAREAGTNFLVVGSEKNTLHEVQQAVKRADQNGIKIQGIIFNGMRPRSRVSGRYRYHAYGSRYGATS